MEEGKEQLFELIENQKEVLFYMNDEIHDHPEYDGEEYFASEMLENYLEQNGFTVEKGVVPDYPTSFRAVYKHGEGGPKLGILTEYDALRGLGHGCGHNLQGPGCLGAAVALKNYGFTEPFELIVYGTPAEETQGAKVQMMEEGCFRELDVALMMHGGPNTQVDIKSLANNTYQVTFYGTRAHAALAPEKGRSAMDAFMLAAQGIEFLREHVPDDIRMHYTLKELPGPANVVPAKCVAEFEVRSFSKNELEEVSGRVKKIFDGAALMADVTCQVIQTASFRNKIPVTSLNNLLMENAYALHAPQIAPPREKTGSTDFGNVMYEIPGSCIRVAFVAEGTSSHTQEFVDAGKTEAGHNAVLIGAKCIAGTYYDLLKNPVLLQQIKEEFLVSKQKNA
ncbi:MAG: M20 family metallopeptidase [Bacillota bacterium]|nr:M20 family metallopeptidase [Bacillota bacterium]